MSSNDRSYRGGVLERRSHHVTQAQGIRDIETLWVVQDPVARASGT